MASVHTKLALYGFLFLIYFIHLLRTIHVEEFPDLSLMYEDYSHSIFVGRGNGMVSSRGISSESAQTMLGL